MKLFWIAFSKHESTDSEGLLGVILMKVRGTKELAKKIADWHNNGVPGLGVEDCELDVVEISPESEHRYPEHLRNRILKPDEVRILQRTTNPALH